MRIVFVSVFAFMYLYCINIQIYATAECLLRSTKVQPRTMNTIPDNIYLSSDERVLCRFVYSLCFQKCPFRLLCLDYNKQLSRSNLKSRVNSWHYNVAWKFETAFHDVCCLLGVIDARGWGSRLRLRYATPSQDKWSTPRSPIVFIFPRVQHAIATSHKPSPVPLLNWSINFQAQTPPSRINTALLKRKRRTDDCPLEVRWIRWRKRAFK